MDVENPTTPAEAALSILYWAVINLDSWGGCIQAGEGWTKLENLRDRPAWDYKHIGFRYEPAEWCQRSLDEAERQRWTRGLRRLEDEGLVVIAARARRTSHFRPTPRGLEAGLSFMVANGGGLPNLDAIRTALKRAEWARPLELYLAAITAVEIGDPSPYLAVAAAAQRQLRQWAAELKITPKTRGKAKSQEVDDDPLTAILNRKTV